MPYGWAPLGVGAAIHRSPHTAIECQSATLLYVLSAHLSLPDLCVSACTHCHVHLCDCLCTGVSFSWQVWRSLWGWWRDPEALARGELLRLWERTVMMLRGSMRSTATMLSSVTAFPWTGASQTTGLKSMSIVCFFSFFVMYILPPTTARYLFFPLAGLCNVRETCNWKVCQFNPAVDGLYFCEGTQCTAGLFARKQAFSSSTLIFFFILFFFLLIIGILVLLQDMYCAKIEAGLQYKVYWKR